MGNVIFTLIAIALAAMALGWTPSVEWAKAQWAFIWDGFNELATGKPKESERHQGAEFLNGVWLLWRRVLGVLAVLALLVALIASPVARTVADGSWQSLHDAIVAFQIEHGLNGDGIWGPKTHDVYRKGE